MAKATSANESESVLTLDEFALLMMTSPGHIPQPKEGETLIITTKDSYLWAVLFSELVSIGKDDDPEWFMTNFRAVLKDNRDSLREWYGDLIAMPRGHVGRRIFYDTATKCEIDPLGLYVRTEEAYLNLLRKGLLEDPFKKKIAGFVLAVIGLVPTGATSTTEKGGAFVKEVHAITWSYVDKMDANQKETRKVEIRLLKIIKVLQPKLLEAYDEIVMGDDDEETTAKQE
jgi:hypothetical protein